MTASSNFYRVHKHARATRHKIGRGSRLTGGALNSRSTAKPIHPRMRALRLSPWTGLLSMLSQHSSAPPVFSTGHTHVVELLRSPRVRAHPFLVERLLSAVANITCNKAAQVAFALTGSIAVSAPASPSNPSLAQYKAWRSEPDERHTRPCFKGTSRSWAELCSRSQGPHRYTLVSLRARHGPPAGYPTS